MPAMQDPKAPPPTDTEVLAALAPVANRIAKAAITDKRAVLQVLEGDEAARELLAAAFAEGEASGKRAAAGVTIAGRPTEAPDWADIESHGERLVLAREMSLCSRCLHGGVCRVAPPAEMLVVISRCAAFAEV